MISDVINAEQPRQEAPAAPEPTAAADDYSFADGDLSGFMDGFNRPKQDMHIDEAPDAGDEYFSEGEGMAGEMGGLDPDAPLVQPTIPLRDARQMAKGLVIGGDELIANIMGAFNEGDKEPFKLDDAQKLQVTESLALVMKYNHAQVSPGWGLAILLLAIYGGKVTLLVQLRRQRSENKKLKAEIERLHKQLDKKSDD